VQAAIASLLADVPCDWRQIAARYGQLARLTGSPVVEFGRADDAYRRAWQLADDGAERRFLERLLAGATGPS
jgi:predicted RNA polymerase sigma factor